MLRIGICDDDNNILFILEKMLEDLGKKHSILTVIKTFTSGTMMLESIDKGNTFDLIFLDIEMEKVDGIQVGHYIRKEKKDDSTEIVYISGQSEYALRLFELRPINFLIKPFKEEDVEGVFLTCLRVMKRKCEYFAYKIGHEYFKIEVREITYFKSDNKYIRIIGEDDKLLDVFLGTMDELYEKVKDLGFVYIHKSYIVNDMYIQRFKSTYVELANGVVLPVSQSKRKNIIGR